MGRVWLIAVHNTLLFTRVVFLRSFSAARNRLASKALTILRLGLLQHSLAILLAPHVLDLQLKDGLLNRQAVWSLFTDRTSLLARLSRDNGRLLLRLAFWEDSKLMNLTLGHAHLWLSWVVLVWLVERVSGRWWHQVVFVHLIIELDVHHTVLLVHVAFDQWCGRFACRTDGLFTVRYSQGALLRSHLRRKT